MSKKTKTKRREVGELFRMKYNLKIQSFGSHDNVIFERKIMYKTRCTRIKNQTFIRQKSKLIQNETTELKLFKMDSNIR